MHLVKTLNVFVYLSQLRYWRLINRHYSFFNSHSCFLYKSIQFWVLYCLLLLLIRLLLLLHIDRPSLQISMEPKHCLSLTPVHPEVLDSNFILINLTTRFCLVPDIHIGATSCEPLLQQLFIVTDLELVSCKAQLVILKASLFFSRK